MTTSEKVAYLKGLAEGMGIQEDGGQGKLFHVIIDILEDLSLDLADTKDALVDLTDGVEEIRDDLAELENEFYESPCSCCGGDDEDEEYDDEDEDDTVFYSVECPGCGFKLTVDAYVYDSTTQCGFMTMLLEHDKPIPDEYLLLNNDGEIGGLSGLYLNFNQYGRCYLIPEKTTPALLAFTFYFRADMTAGTNLLVSFPEPVASRQLEAEQAREAAIPVIRERLKKELTPEQAAEKVRELGFPGGYTGEYDDYYYLAASEYDTAQDDQPSPMTQELQALEAQLKQELTPDEAEQKLRSLWGDELVEETFADQMENVPIFAYSILAERAEPYGRNALRLSPGQRKSALQNLRSRGRLCELSVCPNLPFHGAGR